MEFSKARIFKYFVNFIDKMHPIVRVTLSARVWITGHVYSYFVHAK